MASGEEHYYSKTDVSKSIRWVVALVVGTIALVLGIVLIASTISHSRGDSSQQAAAMTDAAVAARIKPVGEVKVDPNQPAAEAAAAPTAPAATPADQADPAAAPADQAAAAPAAAPATEVAAAAATTAAAASATAAAPAAADGKAAYDQACALCHAAGIAGAPKFGDKIAWGPRVATGKDTLYASALKGKNAMPAKGGNAALADDAVKAAVDYMLGEVQ